jgi:hypothetical protein
MNDAIDPLAFRASLLDGLRSSLAERFGAEERFCGVFEGGSAATGRADRYSDIDLCLVAAPALNDALFEAVEAAVGNAAAITHTWKVADAPWPGFAQRFYLLEPAPRFFFVDCCILEPDTAKTFLERERHGEALVYYDRRDTLRPTPLDRGAFAARLRKRFDQVQSAWPFYLLLVRKELARGRPLDAHAFYSTTLRLLVELAGMRHRPERFDFGWRYLHHDLPADLQSALQRWLYVDGPESIEGNLAAMDGLKSHLVAEIQARPSILEQAALHQ